MKFKNQILTTKIVEALRTDFICFALCTLIFAFVFAGCGPKEPPGVKECRALAAENMTLKKQLERREMEMDLLKEKHSREVERLEKRIADYRKERDEWRERAQQNVRDQAKEVADAVIAENAKLSAENERLKAQVAELKKEP
jgi:hypothetical protein